MQKKFKNIFQKSVDFYSCLVYYNTCKEQENKTSNKNEGENKMKEYKVRYMWNGKIFAEPVMGTSLWDATITFIE